MEDYRVERALGSGSYGTVHLAEHLASGSKVAVKIVPVCGMSAADRSRALTEVALLSHLVHPCIVRALDAFVQDGHLHVVMEYCEGGDLSVCISQARRERRVFTEQQILEWVAQLALSLVHLHSRRVLHRDLKSGNVFLSGNVVRLGDFGIAKVLQNSFDSAKTVIGTPYYLSPEVCRNAPYDEKSDVWSLGCVLYELCSLRHAFSSDNLLALVFMIVQEGHCPLPPSTPPSLVHLVDALLSKDAAGRPTAEQILRLPCICDRLEDMAGGPCVELAEHCTAVLDVLRPDRGGTG